MARHSAFRRSLLSLSLSPLFLYSSEDARKTGPSVRHGPGRDTVKPGPTWARSSADMPQSYPSILDRNRGPNLSKQKFHPKSYLCNSATTMAHAGGDRRRPSRLPSTKSGDTDRKVDSGGSSQHAVARSISGHAIYFGHRSLARSLVRCL